MSAVVNMTSPMNNASMPAMRRCNRRLLTMMRAMSTAFTAAPTQIASQNSSGSSSVVASIAFPPRFDEVVECGEELLELGELLQVLGSYSWTPPHLVDEPDARVGSDPAALVGPVLLDHGKQVLVYRLLDRCRDVFGQARGAAVEGGDLSGLMEGGLPGVRVVLVHRDRDEGEQDAEEHAEGADHMAEDAIPLLGIVDDPAHDRPQRQDDQARDQHETADEQRQRDPHVAAVENQFNIGAPPPRCGTADDGRGRPIVVQPGIRRALRIGSNAISGCRARPFDLR